MADVLAPLGYTPVGDAAEADLVILNTCHIREKAAEKVYSELGRLQPLKQRERAAGGPADLAVAGCVAQAEGAELLARAPFVDLVVGPQTYHRLPELVARRAIAPPVPFSTPIFRPKRSSTALPEPTAAPGASAAFLTVQEGCDKFCTFCVVPYTRGAEFSRPVVRRRGRSAPSGRGTARARSPCSARTSTPITAVGRTVRNGGSAG